MPKLHNQTAKEPSLDYRTAGVNIEEGQRLIDNISQSATGAKRPEVISGIGDGFCGLFDLGQHRYKNPVLASATDGVGTKLKLALACKEYHSIGIDLVAMCVNDIITCGAEPLFFLDYYATGRLDAATAAQVIQGISAGCQEANTVLIGGETAEMPGLYAKDDYDIAGFCVGIVEKERILQPQQVLSNDVLIGIAASGPHANGFSLIRHIIDTHNFGLNQIVAEKPLKEHLLTPTHIYAKTVRTLLNQHTIHGLAHITGGGLLENIPRILPQGVEALLDPTTWEWPPIFHWLQAKGKLTDTTLHRTFNCGIGMVCCVPENTADACLQTLHTIGEPAWKIGKLRPAGNPAQAPKVHILS